MEIPTEMLVAQDAIAEGLAAFPGLLGVDIGFQERQGELTNEIAVRIIVGPDDDVPPEVSLLLVNSVVPIVVIRREFTPLADTGFHQPIQGGISISAGHGGLAAGGGTLGGFGRDDLNGGALCGVSCAHVIAESKFQLPVLVGDPVFQPEAGEPRSRQIGALLRADPDIDAALFSFTIPPNQVSHATILGLGAYGGLPAGPPRLGDPVVKRGRTTRVTHGIVCGVRRKTLPGPAPSDSFEVFRSPNEPTFCDHGDSGSFLLNEVGEVVGLLLQGGLRATIGVSTGFVSGHAMDMRTVCSRLSVSV
jgi:hypothetical protein